jgi:hypothetical protein
VGEKASTLKKNTEAVLDACKELDLDVDPQKIKYMLILRYQKVGQKHIRKKANSIVEDVAECKFFRTALMDQNCMHEEIKSRLNFGNVCYHSVQRFLSFRLLCGNINLKYAEP